MNELLDVIYIPPEEYTVQETEATTKAPANFDTPITATGAAKASVAQIAVVFIVSLLFAVSLITAVTFAMKQKGKAVAEDN